MVRSRAQAFGSLHETIDAFWRTARIADSNVAIEVSTGEAKLFGCAMREMRDGCGCDIAAPAIFERHGDSHAHAKIANLARSW